MASTYTTNLGIEKIATGEQSGTWGDTTNTNFDILDEAVNGIISVTLSSAGSSGSPTALPITDGASSNGRNKFIEFVDGGDLGGTAYVQLTPNNAEKVVHIRNSLSSSRSVIVFQGTYNASNDFEIVNGADVLLKFNGGGSGATVTDVNVDLTVTGATIATADINGGAIDGAVIGGASAAAGTFTTANATTVDTTNIEVTNIKAKDGTAAGSIADSTGVVTLASSVLTTADINGGTADAVVIGGASAAAGTFTTFTSNGIDDNANAVAITIDSSERTSFTSASNRPISAVSTGTNAFVTFQDTNSASIAHVKIGSETDDMVFYANAQERMRIKGANVGIGSTSNHAGARVVINDTPPTAFGSPMFQVGQETFTGSGMYSIGFGYTTGTYTEPPVEIAALTTSDSGGTKADIVFGTRNATTNTAVTERMRIAASGAVSVTGALSKGSGSFKIDHPLEAKKDTHYLVHSFVEGPQADLIYRGKLALVDGSATVNLDDAARMSAGTFVLLNTNVQCFTSNESGWTAVKGSVSGNVLTITSQESCTDTVSWMVVGERCDQHMLDTEWTDSNGRVIVEPLKGE